MIMIDNSMMMMIIMIIILARFTFATFVGAMPFTLLCYALIPSAIRVPRFNGVCFVRA